MCAPINQHQHQHQHSMASRWAILRQIKKKSALAAGQTIAQLKVSNHTLTASISTKQQALVQCQSEILQLRQELSQLKFELKSLQTTHSTLQQKHQLLSSDFRRVSDNFAIISAPLTSFQTNYHCWSGDSLDKVCTNLIELTQNVTALISQMPQQSSLRATFPT